MATVPGDNPITSFDQDDLKRQALARHLAAELRELDASQGSVFAVMGPWGSGKTSLINMTRLALAEEPTRTVVEFNPWMFSGTEQLVNFFFIELVAELKRLPRLAALASQLTEYGELLGVLGPIPVVGAWSERTGKAIKEVKAFREKRGGGIAGKRRKISEQLQKLDDPLIVVLDDIDRLDSSEIRDLFKLVRLTANFPNVIYLLAFDRARVECALTGDGRDGRDYLEKIVQASVNVPAIPETLLLTQLYDALNTVLAAVVETPRFSSDRWTDIVAEIVRPLVHSMRDVRRYAAGVRVTLRSLNNQVEIVDVLALEAIRIFAPDLFDVVVSSQVALTTVHSGFGNSIDEKHKAQIEKLVDAKSKHATVAEAMIRRLFPAAERYLARGAHYGPDFLKTWLRSRRVAHGDILSLYVEKTIGDSLSAFTDAERAIPLLSSREHFSEFLDAVELDRRVEVIAALENFEGELPREAVTPAVTVLLNSLPSLSDRKDPSLHAINSRELVVTRLVLRLLRVCEDEDHVESAVRDILPQVDSLSAKLELLETIGHRKGSGHELVPESVALELENELSLEICEATDEQLKGEYALSTLLLWMRQQRYRTECTFMDELLNDLEVARKILLDARSEVRSQSADSRTIHRHPRLQWSLIGIIYADDKKLASVIRELHEVAGQSDEVIEALGLADRYLAGWKPDSIDNDDDLDD